ACRCSTPAPPIRQAWTPSRLPASSTGSSRACTSSRRTWTPMSSSTRGSRSSRCPGHAGRWKASSTVLAASRGTDDALPNAKDGKGTERQLCHPAFSGCDCLGDRSDTPPKSVSSHALTVLSRGTACRTFSVRYVMMGPGSVVHNWCTPSSASREESPMTEKTAKSVHNLGYHAHIYYDPTSTRAVAEGVCAALGEKFQVEIDGFRDT